MFPTTKSSFLVRTNRQSNATEKHTNISMLENKKSSSTNQNLDSNHGTGTTSSVSSLESRTFVTDRSASEKQFIGIGIGTSEEETTTSGRENNRKLTLPRRPSFYSDFHALGNSKVVLALEDYDGDLAKIASSDNSCSRHNTSVVDDDEEEEVASRSSSSTSCNSN